MKKKLIKFCSIVLLSTLICGTSISLVSCSNEKSKDDNPISNPELPPTPNNSTQAIKSISCDEMNLQDLSTDQIVDLMKTGNGPTIIFEEKSKIFINDNITNENQINIKNYFKVNDTTIKLSITLAPNSWYDSNGTLPQKESPLFEINITNCKNSSNSKQPTIVKNSLIASELNL